MIRGQAVECGACAHNAENIAVLGKLLNDEAPRVRMAAREALIDCDGRPGLKGAVRQAGLAALNAPGAYGQEQAAFVPGGRWGRCLRGSGWWR